MAKRNKGTSKASRKSYSMSKRKEFEADKKVMLNVLSLFPDWELEDTHRILYSLLRSIEATIEKEGKTPPKYVEHRVTHVEHDLGPLFVYCKRCRYAQFYEKDSMGIITKCTHPNIGGELYCSHHDGCTFGIKK